MANKLDLAETESQREDAAFEMMMDALAQDRSERRKTKRICIVCATISIIGFLITGVLMTFLASGITITTDESTTTTTTTQTGEGDSVQFNNVEGNMSIGGEG